MKRFLFSLAITSSIVSSAFALGVSPIKPLANNPNFHFINTIPAPTSNGVIIYDSNGVYIDDSQFLPSGKISGYTTFNTGTYTFVEVTQVGTGETLAEVRLSPIYLDELTVTFGTSILTITPPNSPIGTITINNVDNPTGEVAFYDANNGDFLTSNGCNNIILPCTFSDYRLGIIRNYVAVELTEADTMNLTNIRLSPTYISELNFSVNYTVPTETCGTGLEKMICNATSSFMNTTGFTPAQSVKSVGGIFILPILGGGLMMFQALIKWIIILAMILGFVYYCYRTFKMYGEQQRRQVKVKRERTKYNNSPQVKRRQREGEMLARKIAVGFAKANKEAREKGSGTVWGIEDVNKKKQLLDLGSTKANK